MDLEGLTMNLIVWPVGEAVYQITATFKSAINGVIKHKE